MEGLGRSPQTPAQQQPTPTRQQVDQPPGGVSDATIRRRWKQSGSAKTLQDWAAEQGYQKEGSGNRARWILEEKDFGEESSDRPAPGAEA